MPLPPLHELTRAYLSLIGKRGGAKGGKARAAALSPERRSEIARIAGLAPKKKRRKRGAA